MRVIVTEKGQDLRKEFFYDSVNAKKIGAEDFHLKSLEQTSNNIQIMTSGFNKSRRGLSHKGSTADLY
jgi:hypothetical protein